MSSTRHAPQGSVVSFKRYMSSPEYMELRGIPGTAVAAKAQLYPEVRKRGLLFFLQSLSIKPGGLRFVARALLERLPSCSEGALTELLVELCINPKIELSDGAASDFDRVIGTLHWFQDAYEAHVQSDFVMTTIGREI